MEWTFLRILVRYRIGQDLRMRNLFYCKNKLSNFYSVFSGQLLRPFAILEL